MTLYERFADNGLNALRNLVIENQLPLMFERSLRIQSGCVEDRRALFTLPVDAMGSAGLTEVLQICGVMSSPTTFQNSIQRFFHRAEFVHFGFECSGLVLIGKCYLELSQHSLPEASSVGRLNFVGFKWSMTDDSLAVVSRYRSLAELPWADIQKVMLTDVPADFRDAVAGVLSDFQHSTDQPVSTVDELRLLKVTEEGSNRVSYDLNVYSMARPVAVIADSLRVCCHRLGGDSSSLNKWIHANSLATVGHVSVGLNRRNAPFLTIYHSADINELSSR